MAKVLFVDPEKCTGCMCCMMACALKHGSVVGPAQSMILPVIERSTLINIPVVCRQCARPLCAEVCPTKAISRNEETGAMIVDDDLCMACGMCMLACPLGGISVNRELGHAVKCDLCGGDPECVKVCTFDALQYLPEEEITVKQKSEAIKKLATMLEKIA